MVKKGSRKFRKKNISSVPTLVGKNIYDLLKAMGGNEGKSRMASLWQNWADVAGEEFSWVEPLGHKENILFLGVEDAMEIQELTFNSEKILARVNAFMGSEYFTRLKISLRCYRKK